MTARQIVWLQAYELLRTGAVVWPRLEPTNGEIRALMNREPAAKSQQIYDSIRNQWGQFAKILDVDLSYLSPPATLPDTQAGRADYHRHMLHVTARDSASKLVRRVRKRFSGHPRKASIDSDIGYLLGITRQSAHYLRRSMEQLLGRKMQTLAPPR